MAALPSDQLLESLEETNITMVHGRKIIIVMPAYNAEKTLKKTYDEIPHEYVDDVILVDDSSSDRPVQVANELHIKTW